MLRPRRMQKTRGANAVEAGTSVRATLNRNVLLRVYASWPAMPSAAPERRPRTAGSIVREVDVLCASYRGYLVCGMPPPSSGGIAVLHMLGVLARFDLAARKPGSAEAAHLIAEAGRLAFADRNRYVGDPAFVSVPLAGLISPAYLAERRKLMSPDRSMGVVAAGVPPGYVERGTSHMSIVDLVRQDVTINRVEHEEFLSEEGARYRQSGMVEIPFLEQQGEPLLLELQEFVRAASTGTPPRVTAHDGVEALRLVARVRAAAAR